MHKIYKESIKLFNKEFTEISCECGNRDIFDFSFIKSFFKQHTIKIIEGEIERLLNLERPIKKLTTYEQNWYFVAGFNLCIQDQISHLEQQLELIKEEYQKEKHNEVVELLEVAEGLIKKKRWKQFKSISGVV